MSDGIAGWDSHVHVFDASAPVREGHYRPADRPLAQIEAEAAKAGVQHLVLVQPSVYGADNSLLLKALSQQPGRHRGVVVLDAAPAAEDLAAMHTAGVRGVRLNRVSPVGEADDLAARFEQLAPLLRSHDWHLQWYVPPEQLGELVPLHAQSGVVCVLDHLAGLHVGVEDDHAAWSALAALAAQGAWIKLSGWYRLGAIEPYDSLLPLIRKVAALFGDHLMWGSDWPHTSFPADQLPAYRSTWAPVAAALGPQRAEALRCRTPAPYR